MIVLLLIYVFQFDEVPSYFKRILNIDDSILSSLGFEKFDNKDELVLRLLTPTTFLIVNIIQIHYFNRPWLKLTDEKLIEESVDSNTPNAPLTESTEASNSPKLEHQETITSSSKRHHQSGKLVKKESFGAFVKRISKKVYDIYSLCTIYAWHFVELHIYKSIAVVVALYCITQVTFLNFVLLCTLLISLILDKINERTELRVQRFFSGFVQLWVSLLTIASMLFQLKFVQSPLVTNCTFTNPNITHDPFLLKPQDNLKYIGIYKSNDIQQNLKYYIIIFLLLTFEKIIAIKMRYFRMQTQRARPVGILFESITWRDIDIDFLSLAKYIVNYGFYRFGLEICFFVTTMVIIIRMDAYAILYGVWLGLFLRLRRKAVNKIWTVYFVFLLLLMPIQYFWCIGLPPVFCLEYPWSKANQLDPLNIVNKLRVWLFLPDYSDPPNSFYLIADFFQIFFVWLQLGIFRLESKKNFEENGGSNIEIVYENQKPYKDNPFMDFISESKTYLDKFKYLIFMYSYWIVLAIVFLTGTSRISILCMGYVILSFFFLWYGQTFLILPLEKLLKYWNIMVFYCFVVIFIKACLQIVLCLLTNKISEKLICVLIDIFGINCRTLPSKQISSN